MRESERAREREGEGEREIERERERWTASSRARQVVIGRIQIDEGSGPLQPRGTRIPATEGLKIPKPQALRLITSDPFEPHNLLALRINQTINLHTYNPPPPRIINTYEPDAIQCACCAVHRSLNMWSPWQGWPTPYRTCAIWVLGSLNPKP